MLHVEPFIETVDVQWPPEMSKGNDLVAVTVSHPPGQGYEEKAISTANSAPAKYAEPPKEETFVDVKVSSCVGLRHCEMCEKEVHGEQSVCYNWCRAVVYCSALCQKQHWKETHKGMCGLCKAMMEREEELAMKFFVFPCSAFQPCKWLESLDIHHKGKWRRKCSCQSHIPYGQLPVNGGLWDSSGGLDDDEYPRDSPFHNHLGDGMSSPILLSGWTEYYNRRSLSMSSPVADFLSHPLTIYYILTALNISSKNLLLKGKEVILHYHGPEGELDWMPAFAEIGHLLNGMSNIQIVESCEGTLSGGSHLPILTSCSFALNCGFEKYASWGGALNLIKSMGVPASFADQSEISCANAKQVLRSAGLHITQTCDTESVPLTSEE